MTGKISRSCLGELSRYSCVCEFLGKWRNILQGSFEKFQKSRDQGIGSRYDKNSFGTVAFIVEQQEKQMLQKITEIKDFQLVPTMPGFPNLRKGR